MVRRGGQGLQPCSPPPQYSWLLVYVYPKLHYVAFAATCMSLWGLLKGFQKVLQVPKGYGRKELHPKHWTKQDRCFASVFSPEGVGNVPQGSPWLSVSVSVLSWVLLIPRVERKLRTGLLSFADVPMSGGGGDGELWPFLHLDYGWTSCVCAEKIRPKSSGPPRALELRSASQDRVVEVLVQSQNCQPSLLPSTAAAMRVSPRECPVQFCSKGGGRGHQGHSSVHWQSSPDTWPQDLSG